MQPDPLAIYLDENHCNNKSVLAVLERAGIKIERHLDHFRSGTPDADWLPFVGSNGWALLTSDGRIRYRSNEKQAVVENSIRMFYFSNNNMSGQQMAIALEKALPKIRRLFAKRPPPFFAAITPTGEVHLREEFSHSVANASR